MKISYVQASVKSTGRVISRELRYIKLHFLYQVIQTLTSIVGCVTGLFSYLLTTMVALVMLVTHLCNPKPYNTLWKDTWKVEDEDSAV